MVAGRNGILKALLAKVLVQIITGYTLNASRGRLDIQCTAVRCVAYNHIPPEPDSFRAAGTLLSLLPRSGQWMLTNNGLAIVVQVNGHDLS